MEIMLKLTDWIIEFKIPEMQNCFKSSQIALMPVKNIGMSQWKENLGWKKRLILTCKNHFTL